MGPPKSSLVVEVQYKTTHHFRLYADGGAIEVSANDAKDSQDVQTIRSHLKHIAAMFSQGDFSIPLFVHDQVPPGVLVMKEKRGQISYSSLKNWQQAQKYES